MEQSFGAAKAPAGNNHFEEQFGPPFFPLNAVHAEARPKKTGELVLDRTSRPLDQNLEGLSEPAHETVLDPARIDPHLFAINEYGSPAAGPFNQLAVEVMALAGQRAFRRILLTSAQHGEGRTSVTLNLAGALARARRRVLVLDCDLAQPSALRLLGVDAKIGLVEALAEGLPLVNAVTRVRPADFDILAARERVANSLELLASSKFQELLEQCAYWYHFVLFDSPPLLASADARLLKRLTDTTLLVVRPGTNSPAQMAKALAPFTAEELCGVVLNRAATS